MAEAQTELLTQERDEIATEIRAGPANPEIVTRAPGHEPLGADPHVVDVFNGVGHAVGGTEPEEHTDPPIGYALGAPEVRVEVIVNGPCVVQTVERLGRDEQRREEALQEPHEDWARVGQAGKPLGQEQPREVGGLLLERETLLITPPAPQELVADQAKGLDRNPALGGERELYVGELSDVKNASLPIFAALGGMVMPALLHFGLNRGTATQGGIGIPMATDIVGL